MISREAYHQTEKNERFLSEQTREYAELLTEHMASNGVWALCAWMEAYISVAQKAIGLDQLKSVIRDVAKSLDMSDEDAEGLLLALRDRYGAPDDDPR